MRTPRLRIALEPPFQHRGLGEVLRRGAPTAPVAQGVAQISLAVHAKNLAVRLYER